MVSYYDSQTVFLLNLTINMLLCWIFCLQHNVSVDFVNPQGMVILGNFTCGYMGYIYRGLWPLYCWPTHLTKVFHNSNLVKIICLPYCHSIFMIKKFISPATGEILAPAGKKRRLLGYVKTLIIFFSVVFKRNDHCKNINSFKKGVTQQHHFFKESH